MSKIIKYTTDECMEQLNRTIEDVEYTLKRTKVPAKKRQHKYTLGFFTSLKEHISELQKLKQDGKKSNRD